MNDNPLAALAMRERAADELDRDVADLKADASRFRSGTDPHHGRMTFAESAKRQSVRIRALPTTFTDAELLAAAMQLPEVRALVNAAKRAAHATTNDGITGRVYTDEAIALQYALAPFMKGGA